jgi:hypothetical protein
LRQQGQALVAVLVVMTLVFLMAGSVAVGASALLDREHHQQEDPTFLERSAVAAAVANAESGGCAARTPSAAQPASPLALPSPSDAGATPAALPTPTPSPVASVPSLASPVPAAAPVPGQLLELPGDVRAMAYCVRLAGAAGMPSQQTLAWPPGTGCGSTVLPAMSRAWIFFDARWEGMGKVWVDGGTDVDQCQPPAGSTCVTRVVTSPVMVSIVPVALDCDLTGIPLPVLHVAGALRSPEVVFSAAQVSGGGLLLLAVGTGAPDVYEQVVLAVQGGATALRYWAPLG